MAQSLCGKEILGWIIKVHNTGRNRYEVHDRYDAFGEINTAHVWANNVLAEARYERYKIQYPNIRFDIIPCTHVAR